MKVILTADIPKIGRKLDVKEVAGGFFRNFLFPRKLAEMATDANLATLEVRKTKVEAQRVKKLEELGAMLASLQGKQVSISAKANEEGHLFAGIRAPELKDAILKELNIDAPLEAIVLEQPIKALGEHEVTLEAAGKEAKLTIVVERSVE